MHVFKKFIKHQEHMNWKSGPRIRPQDFIFSKAGVMNWKSVTKSGLNTLYYLGPDGRTGARLWAGLNANPASLPSDPRANVNRPLHCAPPLPSMPYCCMHCVIVYTLFSCTPYLMEPYMCAHCMCMPCLIAISHRPWLALMPEVFLYDSSFVGLDSILKAALNKWSISTIPMGKNHSINRQEISETKSSKFRSHQEIVPIPSSPACSPCLHLKYPPCLDE